MHHGKWATTAIVTVILATVAVVLLVTGNGASVKAADRDPVPASTVGDAVGALQQPRSAADALPEAAVEEVGDIGPPSALPDESVRALSRGAWDAYLTPAGASVCLSVTDPDGGATVSCSTGEDLKAGLAPPAAALLGCEAESIDAPATCRSALMWGVVPDGVEEVQVLVNDGAAPRVDVQRNAYLVQVSLDQGPHGVTYKGPSGTVTQTMPLNGGPPPPIAK
jgi:hypothetical protein